MGKNKQFNINKHILRDWCAESASARRLHRLHAVALVAHGLSASEVAGIFDDSPRAVAYWVKRYQQHGLKGLEEESRPGRPSKLNANQTKKLQSFVKRSHTSSKLVNAKTVASFIQKELGITLTIRQCWRILKRLQA